MVTNWEELGKQIGSIYEGGERGGDIYAQTALEAILGQTWIESTVEHIVSFKRG